MKRSFAFIIALILCFGSAVMVVPDAKVDAAEVNLLADAVYTYEGGNNFLGNCTDYNSAYLNDGKYRGDGETDFDDFYGVPGTTVECYGTGVTPIVLFTLKDISNMNYIVLRGVRRSGNRYLSVTGIAVSEDGNSFSSVAFEESAEEIEDAPYFSVSTTVSTPQYFDVTLTFSETATNVKYLRLSFSAYDPTTYTTQYVCGLDEIEAYGSSTGSYKAAAELSLSADRTEVRPGDYVTVTVTVDNITTPNGIVACDLPLFYSHDKLELVSVSEIYPNEWGAYGMYVGDSNKNASPYWLRSICDASDLLTNSAYYIKASGKLGFILTFKALSEGEADITVDNSVDADAFALVVDAKGFVNYGATGDTVTVTVSGSAAPVYTVSYDANGGSGAPAPQTKTQGVSLTVSDVVPTRSGYTFVGWAASPDATASAYSAGGRYTADASVVLYAVWEKQGASYLLGDVNRDGKVNNLDAARVLKFGAGLITFDDEQLLIGDVNGDGKVNSLDAAWILKYDAGIISGFETNR